MNILILNWRDIKNPDAGGAELLTHEIAKRLARDGHEITQISARWEGCKKEEIVDDVKIIRLGSWWTVHIHAIFYYIFHLRNWADVVVDEVHWFPFFSKLYAPKKTILLACEVARERFGLLFPKPVALFWRFLERIYLFIYKSTPTLTISESTKKDLLAFGFLETNITVLPMGITVPAKVKEYPKEKKPTIIYLGRLNKLKGAEDAVEVLRLVKEKVQEATLWFVGVGKEEYTNMIKSLIKKNNLSDDVLFFGFVSEQKKFELLSRAHVLIVPSVHEGWGLIVSEAGYVGTPAVVYDVSGLRDTTIDGKTGLVVGLNPESLAEGVVKLLSDRKLYMFISNKVRSHFRKISWQKTSEKTLAFIFKRIK